MAEYYVAPTGSAANSGLITSPWTLDYACGGAGGVIVAGDTIWLRKGLYTKVDGFQINTVGSVGTGVDNPDGKIRWRNFPRELASIIASGDNQDSLQINGNYNWVLGTIGRAEGIEVYRPVLTRVDPRGTCIWFGATPQSGNKAINVIVHDGANGILNGGFTADYQYGEMEVYGCISFNNGTEDTSSRVHGMYLRHQGVATKLRCTNNVVFNQLGLGIQIYVGTGASHDDGLRNIWVNDNIVWGAGSLGTLTGDIYDNILFGGIGGNVNSPARGCQCLRNVLYQPTQSEASAQMHVGGNNVTNEDMEVSDNYMVGSAFDQTFGAVRIMPFRVDGNPSLKFNRNEIIPLSYTVVIEINQAGSVANFTQWQNNKYSNPVSVTTPDSNTSTLWRNGGVNRTFPAWKASTLIGGTDTADIARPTVNKTFVIPANKYNANYGYFCYFNWEQGESVNVNLSTILAVGDKYEIYNVQSWRTGVGFGAPIQTGEYGGGVVAIPVAGVEPPFPIGITPRTPIATSPFFDAFFVRKADPILPPDVCDTEVPTATVITLETPAEIVCT